MKKIVNLFCILALKLRPLLTKIIPKPFLKYVFSRFMSTVKFERTTEIDKTLPAGINLIGYVRTEVGLGEGVRAMAKALKAANIPFCMKDIKVADSNMRAEDSSFDSYLVDEVIYNINVIHINPDFLSYLKLRLPIKNLKGRYNIGYVAWELADLPKEWLGGIEYLNEVWTPSDFVTACIKKSTKSPVLTVHHAIEVYEAGKFNRSYFKLPENMFLFLCMYDTKSVTQRKNPIAAVNAFKAAFTPDDNVGIVIKINNSDHRRTLKLKELLAGYNNVFFFESTLSRYEVNSLINVCDSYISLHRSEGFGLVPAEAMYLGKPVIVTNWSGNVDFCKKDNSCLVDYSLVPVEEGEFVYYGKGQLWAEPSVNTAALYMKKLVSDKEFYNKISENAGEYIKTNLSKENIGNLIKNRIKQINNWNFPE